MIKNFNDWQLVTEAKKEGASEFVESVEKILKDRNVSYKLESSNAQLNNGTLTLVIQDDDLVKKSLEERGVKDSDFRDLAAFESKPRIGHYTVYKAGTARKTGAASNGIDFKPDNPSEVVDWIINQYKQSALNYAVYYLKPNNFYKPNKKVKELKLSDVKDLFTSTAYEEALLTEEYGTVCSPYIAFMCFLSKAYISKIKLNEQVNRTLQHTLGKVYLSVTVDNGRVDLEVSPHWTIKKKEMVIVSKPEIRLTGRATGGTWASDAEQLFVRDVLPHRLADVYDQIMKGDYDIDKFSTGIKHVVAAKKYGI